MVMVIVAMKVVFNLCRYLGNFGNILVAKNKSPEGEGREGGGDDVVGHTEEKSFVNHAGLWLLS